MTYEPPHPLIQQLIFEEGLRLKKYHCPAGHWTIGVGRNLDANPEFEGNLIPDELGSRDEALVILHFDVCQAHSQLRAVWQNLDTLDDARRDALVQMAFHMGAHAVAGFKNMLTALLRHEYQKAKLEALDSRWAKHDSPARAVRVANQLLTVNYYPLPC